MQDNLRRIRRSLQRQTPEQAAQIRGTKKPHRIDGSEKRASHPHTRQQIHNATMGSSLEVRRSAATLFSSTTPPPTPDQRRGALHPYYSQVQIEAPEFTHPPAAIAAGGGGEDSPARSELNEGTTGAPFSPGLSREEKGEGKVAAVGNIIS